MRKLLLALILFAAGFWTDRALHRPIVIRVHSTATPVQDLFQVPHGPVEWPGGGGHFEHNDISCDQSMVHCWWET